MTSAAPLFRVSFALIVAGASWGCAAPAPVVSSVAPPSFVAPTPRSKPAVALVLSGGSARGFAHAGVLKVLDANGLKPDIIVGCSAGSIVGALYASGLSASEVEEALADFDLGLLRDVAMPGLGFLKSPLGLVRGDGLHEYVDRHVRRHAIEDFPISFAAVATDLESGVAVAFNHGDAGLAVKASSSVPVLIAPAEIGGKLYSDCQISSPLPVRFARQLGADRVIAVDVIYPPVEAGLTSSLRVAFQALSIATYSLKEWELSGADLVIRPDLPRTSGQLGPADRKMLIEAGYKAAADALPLLRSLYGR